MLAAIVFMASLSGNRCLTRKLAIRFTKPGALLGIIGYFIGEITKVGNNKIKNKRKES